MSTLGGRKVWFDTDVLRLNYDGRGNYLGEFGGTDRILVVYENGEFQTTGFENDKPLRRRNNANREVQSQDRLTAVLDDARQGYPYIKRFQFRGFARRQRFVGDDANSA